MRYPQKKALIIEGDRLTGSEVAAVLGNAGFETVEVMTHEDPLLHAELEKPSIIILDMTSSERVGLDAYWALRASYQTGNIPIVVITDGDRNDGIHNSKADFETVFGVRAPEGIIEKPINAGFLVTCVMGVLG